MVAVLSSPPQISGKRERNKARNRSLILSAARECFIEQGYGTVSVRDIIGRTPLAAGTFYNYFPDKAAVFKALVAEHVGAMNRRLHQARSSAATLEAFLYGAYLATFESMNEDPVFFAFIFRNDARIREFYGEGLFGMTATSMRTDVKSAMQRGLIPQCDIDYLVAAFYGVGYEMGRNFLQRRSRDPEAAATLATRLLLGGVASLAS